MTETRLTIIVASALTLVGVTDLLRRQGLSTGFATALLVLEIAAIVVGVAALLSWGRLRDKRKRSPSG